MGGVNGHELEQPGEPEQNDDPFDPNQLAHIQAFRRNNRRRRMRHRWRNRGPPRHYSQRQRTKALQWLNAGVKTREVAQLIGPRCSSSTPVRWRQQDRIRRAAEQERRRIRALNLNRPLLPLFLRREPPP